MPFDFRGEFVVPKPPEAVFDFLADPGRFCPLLPDFQRLAAVDATHFTVELKVGVAHIRGTATMKMTLEEAERPQRARYSGQGSVAGGTVTTSSGFELQAVDGGTRVLWQGSAQVFGQLASLAGGLLEPLARKNVNRLMDSLQAALR